MVVLGREDEQKLRPDGVNSPSTVDAPRSFLPDSIRAVAQQPAKGAYARARLFLRRELRVGLPCAVGCVVHGGSQAPIRRIINCRGDRAQDSHADVITAWNAKAADSDGSHCKA